MRVLALACCVSLPCGIAMAQPGSDGIDWVTIGAPGNAAYQSANPNDRVNNRGSVGYEYRIGRTEITTAQWVEFINAAFDRPQGQQGPSFVSLPIAWGAVEVTPNNPGGRRWAVPAGNEMRGVGGITWRAAAVYCNWLHNNKVANVEAFRAGAYDVSTFGMIGNVFTDQETHSPGARYWIPSWDEWLKASHFDPNGDGPGQGRWWQYSNGSDTPYTYGVPGVGQANAGFFSPNPFVIPLARYPNVRSPWGLLDVAGATTEWTESVLLVDIPYRFVDGSYWSSNSFAANLTDQIGYVSGEFPNSFNAYIGFRIAGIVPAPGSCAALLGALLVFSNRRRRGAATSTL